MTMAVSRDFCYKVEMSIHRVDLHRFVVHGSREIGHEGQGVAIILTKINLYGFFSTRH